MGARVDLALDRFQLRSLEQRDPHTLSGGEQQRLLIAALAAREPQVLALDEPFSMLDSSSTAAVASDIERLRRSGTAVVVCEHRRSWLAGVEAVAELEIGSVRELPEIPALPFEVPPVRVVVEGLGVEIDGRTLLSGVDLDLRGGSAVAVLGPNGAGKTTLLRALAGLQPCSGRIRIDTDATATQASIGLCFQNADLQIFNATVREEILWGGGQFDDEVYRGVLTLLGLHPYEHTPPLLLSEGEKKRLALAVLLQRPGLCGICLDEPTLGQDERHRAILGVVVERLTQAGYLCVIATHDRDWAARWCDEIVWMADGCVVATGEGRRAAGRGETAMGEVESVAR
jgi:energy-coupling factor transporter ATP-binding protein EcfA2